MTKDQQHFDWLPRLYELDVEATYDEAIDLVFEEIDGLQYAGHGEGRWPRIDALISTILDDEHQLSIQLLIALLSINSCIRLYLVNYERLYDHTLEIAKSSGRSENGMKLLRGLEPVPMGWVETVFSLDEKGENRRSIELLYREADKLFRRDEITGDRSRLESFLADFDWSRRPSLAMIVVVLTITARTRPPLSGYGDFLDLAREHIIAHHPERNVDAMLEEFESQLSEQKA